ncbi:protein ULTRAPETALA 1 isoform X2 [Musa acuminata AAA Group]|uniref:protein ULTRAPETALA 1 isoform X2 n=1 Tax=Musa acuminata AAA Group TaxID=214697 RepID=UPI0031D1E498
MEGRGEEHEGAAAPIWAMGCMHFEGIKPTTSTVAQNPSVILGGKAPATYGNDKLTPAAFEKHSGRETARKWKNNVWIMVKGDKVPLSKTVLLKYYNQVSKAANGSHKGPNGRPCHRDEFVCCKKCNKERRFRLRSKEECRNYHDSVRNPNWKCSDVTFDSVTCDDEEERASRKVLRGCSRSPSCRGCTTCVCFGCEICRFSDCSCQTCVDFTCNSKS